MDETAGNHRDAAATASAVEPPAVDRLLLSFLESVGAGSALPLFRASGLSDQSLHKISEMSSQTIHQFGLSPDQAAEFSIRVGQHLTDQFLQKEALDVRSLVENAGFDYSVFASVDCESQQEILTSLKRRRRNLEPVQGQAIPGHRPSFDRDPHSRVSQPQERSERSTMVSIADMAGEEPARSSGSLSQLDLAVSILAEFFPSMQEEAIADMLHCMGLRLDEAVDTILEDVSASSSKRKSSSHTSVSRLEAVRQIGATRSGVEGADWKSVYSWISASTGQSSSSGSAGSSSADASLDSLVAFMKVAMNVDDPAAGAEQSLRERYRQLLSARGPEHQLTVVAACHLAACLVDQKKYPAALSILQYAIQYFPLNASQGPAPSSFAGLSDDTLKNFAHAQILYAECLIADARSNGETASLLLSSMQAAKYQCQLPPERSAADIDASASNMDGEAAPPNVGGNGDAGGLPVQCDACDIVLTFAALCYRCVTCPDFTLCVPCHAKYEHCDSGHDFEVTSTRTPVPPRSLCVADAHLKNALALQPSLASVFSDVSLMRAKCCVAECYLLQRRYSECESIVRELLQKNASERRPNHPIMFRTLMCLAMCLASQFKWDESRTIFEQVLSHYDAQKGRNSADYLAVLMQISEHFYRRGCPLSAISVLEDCHARHVSVRGKADPTSLRCACMLGHFYAVMSDDVRALSILNDAVVTACAAHGDTSVVAHHCKYHLGMALFIQKNVTAALDCLMPLTNSPLPADDLVARARLDIIMHKAKIAVFQCFAILNRLSEAIASLQELQGVHDCMFGRQHKYYGHTLVALARAQHLSGNARAARCLYDKAVPLLSRLMGPQHHDVISANVAYASALIELQQFRVAGPLLESTYDLQVQCMGESNASSVHTLSLVSLCQSLHPDSSGLQRQRTSRSRSSSVDQSSLQSSAQSSPSNAVSWHLSDSEVSFWLLQQQSRDEALSADPPRAPAPPPDISRASETLSILQPIQDSGHSGASEDSTSDIGDS